MTRTTAKKAKKAAMEKKVEVHLSDAAPPPQPRRPARRPPQRRRRLQQPPWASACASRAETTWGAWYCAEIAAVFPINFDVFVGMSNVFWRILCCVSRTCILMYYKVFYAYSLRVFTKLEY